MKDNIINYKYSGFFLIELLIAIGLFSLICLLFSGLHVNISEQQNEAKKYFEAITIASSLMDEAAVYGILPQSLEIRGYKITIEPTANFANSHIDKNNKENQSRRFQLEKITVSWPSKNKNRQISIIFGVIL